MGASDAKEIALPIHTPRLLLRDFAAEDWEAVHAYAADPEVTRFMFYGPRDAADTSTYLDRMLESQREVPRATWELAVVDRARGHVMGACDLTLRNPFEADLGYIFGRPWWGLGYATEAATAMVRAGFEELHLELVFSMCDVNHHASQHVLEKVGLRPQGILEGVREAKGRRWDMWLYELTLAEWLALQGR